MSELEFEEENIQLSQIPQREDLSSFERFIIGTGLAKTRAQANFILVIVALCAFALAFVVLFRFII